MVDVTAMDAPPVPIALMLGGVHPAELEVLSAETPNETAFGLVARYRCSDPTCGKIHVLPICSMDRAGLLALRACDVVLTAHP